MLFRSKPEIMSVFAQIVEQATMGRWMHSQFEDPKSSDGAFGIYLNGDGVATGEIQVPTDLTRNIPPYEDVSKNCKVCVTFTEDFWTPTTGYICKCCVHKWKFECRLCRRRRPLGKLSIDADEIMCIECEEID